MQNHPRISQWPRRDYPSYKSLCQQTKVTSHPNSAGAARPHATWKYKHMLRKMVVPGEKIVKEEEDTDSSILSPPLPAHTRKPLRIYYHLIFNHHRLPILVLLGKLKIQRLEEPFTKVSKVKE